MMWLDNDSDLQIMWAAALLTQPQNGFPNIVRHFSWTLDVAAHSSLCLQDEIATGSGDINLQDKCIQQLSLFFKIATTCTTEQQDE